MSIASRMKAQVEAGGRAVTQTGKAASTYKTTPGGVSTPAASAAKTNNAQASITSREYDGQVFDVEKQKYVPLGVPAKPEGAPRFYTTRGIDPDPGQDWHFDPQQNEWVWTMTEREKSVAAVTKDAYDAQFENISGMDFSTILWNGEVMTVHKDEFGSYIEDHDNGMLHYLAINWFETKSNRLDANKAIVRSVKMEQPQSSGFMLPSIPSFGFGEKKEVTLPNVIPNVGFAEKSEIELPSGIFPKLSGASTALVTGIAIFVGFLVLLLVVGYSGIAGKSSVRR